MLGFRLMPRYLAALRSRVHEPAGAQSLEACARHCGRLTRADFAHVEFAELPLHSLCWTQDVILSDGTQAYLHAACSFGQEFKALRLPALPPTTYDMLSYGLQEGRLKTRQATNYIESSGPGSTELESFWVQSNADSPPGLEELGNSGISISAHSKAHTDQPSTSWLCVNCCIELMSSYAVPCYYMLLPFFPSSFQAAVLLQVECEHASMAVV